MRRVLIGLLVPVILCATETISSDLIAVAKPVTAKEWLRTHSGETLRYGRDAPRIQPISGNPVCAVAEGRLNDGGATEERRAFFRIPDSASLHLPADEQVHPELVNECVLSEIDIEGDSAAVLPQIQKEISSEIGAGKAYSWTAQAPYVLIKAGNWNGGQEWRSGGSRWNHLWKHHLMTVGLTAASQRIASAANEEWVHKPMTTATDAANLTGLPAKEIKGIQTLLGEPRGSSDSSDAVPFLLSWIAQSRKLPAAQAAAGLYSADILLASIPASRQLQMQFAPAGAHFDHDELGGGYSYAHNLLWQAFHMATESAAGQQAFLDLIAAAFHPECCYSGNGFEEVITRASQYLAEHPGIAIRSQVLLAIGDAYRDRIAVANGANGDPFNDAAKYKRADKRSYWEALRNYRAAIKAAPGSDSANSALKQAWSLQAGLPPLETRFFRLYD